MISGLDPVSGAGLPAAWAEQVCGSLFWAGAIADMVEHRQACVVVALESGTDITAVVRARRSVETYSVC